MSTGILTTAPGGRALRRGRRSRVVERSRHDHVEEPPDAGDKTDDAEDQADQGEGSTPDRAAARRDALARDEAHDRRGRPEDDAQADDRAHDRDDADDERRDGQAVRPLSRVAGARRHVHARRRRYVTARRPVSRAGRWRNKATARWWWRRVVTATGRRWRWRRRVVTTAGRRRRRWRIGAATGRRRGRQWWDVRHSTPPYAACGGPISKLRTIHACIASPHAFVNSTPITQNIKPSEATKWTAISIRPAISVLTSDLRAVRTTMSTRRPPAMPPCETASTIDGVRKVSAR